MRAIKSLALTPEVERELKVYCDLEAGMKFASRRAWYLSILWHRMRFAICAKYGMYLKAYGVSEHVLIDLTMIGDFSYYTGMTFEGYAADLGFPVCSGGRYDNLLSQFGRPAPATGFALKTNRILEVTDNGHVDSQGVY